MMKDKRKMPILLCIALCLQIFSSVANGAYKDVFMKDMPLSAIKERSAIMVSALKQVAPSDRAYNILTNNTAFAFLELNLAPKNIFNVYGKLDKQSFVCEEWAKKPHTFAFVPKDFIVLFKNSAFFDKTKQPKIIDENLQSSINVLNELESGLLPYKKVFDSARLVIYQNVDSMDCFGDKSPRKDEVGEVSLRNKVGEVSLQNDEMVEVAFRKDKVKECVITRLDKVKAWESFIESLLRGNQLAWESKTLESFKSSFMASSMDCFTAFTMTRLAESHLNSSLQEVKSSWQSIKSLLRGNLQVLAWESLSSFKSLDSALDSALSAISLSRDAARLFASFIDSTHSLEDSL